MFKNKYIKEISEYKDILGLQIERQYNYNNGITEKESVHGDINSYFDNDFDNWTEKDFIQYILYLEKLTGLTNKLKLKAL